MSGNDRHTNQKNLDNPKKYKWLAIPTLALAGSLVRKKKVPASAGTLPTYSPLFVGWLIAVVLIVGALNFLPALALGPIVEQLMLK